MLLIFDLDGTLIDSRACITKATQEAFKFRGFEVPSENHIVASMGIPIEVTFAQWSGQEDVSELLVRYRSLYAELALTELKPFKGIPEALAILAKDHTLAIATSKKRSAAELSLEVCGLRDFFTAIVGSDDVQNYKPHPESIERILALHPVNKSECWMIGDATSDIEMGETADVCTCAVTWGAHSIDALADLYPTSIIHMPNELLWLFGNRNCGSFLEEMVIRPWTPKDSVERITELLHAAYRALADQGMHYNASHQPPSQTLSRLQGGDSFIAIEINSHTSEETIIGTITMYHARPGNGHPYYERPGLVYFGQFGVDPAYQGYGVARRLYQTVEDRARSIGAAEIALDTAETAHDLIATYRRWGFEIVDEADWNSTNYRSVIMAKPLI